MLGEISHILELNQVYKIREKKRKKKNGFEPDPKSLKKMRVISLNSDYINMSITNIHSRKGNAVV